MEPSSLDVFDLLGEKSSQVMATEPSDLGEAVRAKRCWRRIVADDRFMGSWGWSRRSLP